MQPKVLFICKRRLDSYGHSFGLYNSASFVADFLNHKRIEAKVETAVDGNCVDRLVAKYDPTHVMIEALWVTPAKMHELLHLPRHNGRQWVIRLHSKIPFIANEGIAFEWLKGYRHLMEWHPELWVAPNAREFADDLADTMDLRSIYLPNIYCPRNYESQRIEPHNDGYYHVGCFGAIRPLKNHLIQAVAAVEFGNLIGQPIAFHINAGRLEQHGDQVKKNLIAFFEEVNQNSWYPHKLVQHDWMPHEEFIQVIRRMDLGLQVSLSETFNIVAADFASVGVPVVGSPEIDWMPSWYQADPNSTRDIAHKMLFAERWRDWNLHGLIWRGLMRSNRKAGREWLRFLYC